MINKILVADTLSLSFDWLDFPDIASVRLVCKKWHELLSSVDGRTNKVILEIFKREKRKNYSAAYNPITSVFSLPAPFNMPFKMPHNDEQDTWCYDNQYLCGNSWKKLPSGITFTTFIQPQTGEITYTRHNPGFVFDEIYGVKSSKPNAIDFFDIKTHNHLRTILALQVPHIHPDVRNSKLIPFINSHSNLCVFDCEHNKLSFATVPPLGFYYYEFQDPLYIGSRDNNILIIRRAMHTLHSECILRVYLYKFESESQNLLLKFQTSFDSLGQPNLFSSGKIGYCDFTEKMMTYYYSRDTNYRKTTYNFVTKMCSPTQEYMICDQNQVILADTNELLLNPQYIQHNRALNSYYIENNIPFIRQKNYAILSTKSILSIQEKKVMVYDVKYGLVSKRSIHEKRNVFLVDDMKTVGDKPVKIEVKNRLETVIMVIHSILRLVNSIIDHVAYARPTYTLFNVIYIKDKNTSYFGKLIEYISNTHLKYMALGVARIAYCSFLSIEMLFLFPIYATSASINLVSGIVLKCVEVKSTSEHTKWLADHVASIAFITAFSNLRASISIAPHYFQPYFNEQQKTAND
jgi:hypothetical protein